MKKASLNIKNNIHLGGTARSPEDVQALRALGLQFAELPLTDRFSHELEAYRELKDRLGLGS